MRIGIISDIQFHNWTGFEKDIETGVSKRLLEQVRNFRQALEIFRKKKVDYIVQGGDLVHGVGSESNVVLNFLKELRDESPAPILDVIGNHCTPVRINPLPQHIITNLFKDKSIKVPNNICLVDFTSEDINYKAIKGYDLVVIHKTPTGAESNGRVFLDEVNWRKLASQNKFVAFGHIHEMQKLSENCFIIGSPMHTNFGDKGDRGIWIVDTLDNKLEFIKLDYPEFIVVKTPEEVKENDGNYYKVLECTSKIDKANVVSVIVPEVFDERIQSTDFIDILKEWIKLNNKEDNYFEVIKDVVSDKIQVAKNIFKGKIDSVYGEDFLSIEKVSYDIKKGFILVEGLNGSGKTTVLGELITWILFGIVTKEINSSSIVRNRPEQCNNCVGSITLSSGSDKFEIKRTFKGGLEFKKNGVQPDSFAGLTKPERQNYIKEFLGFGPEFFLAADYFSQEKLQVLTKLSDANQTNMATDLLGFEQYTDLYSQVDSKIKSIDNKIQTWQEDKIRFEKSVAVLSSEIDGISLAIKDKDRQISSFSENVNSHTNKKSQLTKDLSKLKKVEETKVIDYDTKLKELNDKLVSLESKRNRLIDISNESYIIKSGKSNNISRLESDVQHFTDRVNKLSSEIRDLNKLEKNVRCSRCGAMVSDENIGIFKKEKQDEIDKIFSVISEINLKMVALNEEVTLLDNEIKQILGKADQVDVQKTELRQQISSIQQEYTNYQAKVKEYELSSNRIKIQIEEIEKNILSYSSRLNEFISDKEELSTKLRDTQLDLKQTDASVYLIDESIKQCGLDKEKLEFWKTAFSPKGIRSVLLDKFCNEVNKSINLYLSVASQGLMSAVMSPTKTLQSGEERNKISLKVFVNGYEGTYGGLSGGEKKRVDIAVCFGLNCYVTDKYDLKDGLLGLIILDEVFGFLDVNGSESIAQLLKESGQKQAVFVIDHHLGLASWASEIWRTTKTNEITHLENEVVNEEAN